MSEYKLLKQSSDDDSQGNYQNDNYLSDYSHQSNFNFQNCEDDKCQYIQQQDQNQELYQFPQYSLKTEISNNESSQPHQFERSEDDPNQQPAETQTKKIRDKYKKPDLEIKKKISKGEPIVGKKSQNKKHQQKTETKNLPKFFINCFLNRLEKEDELEPSQNVQIKKKINKFASKSSSLKTLQEMLQDNIINKIVQEYICSFEFLHQILKSERLQDVSHPIKYSHKLYQGCFNSNALNQWKES
ncbi:unnamed protein product [Paramecium sonneborni]|uniref:Uncharacterized protein n=1 Tax=Paramecium sonneborni TaxID=65129 RepID=A0A8S1R2H0_9CILI|nr:unnamed protein product [Paramecium sonneborni]